MSPTWCLLCDDERRARGSVVRRIFTDLLLIAIIAVVTGFGTALIALEQSRNRGTVAIGPWTAVPGEGSSQSNPYATAIAATTLDLPLGTA